MTPRSIHTHGPRKRGPIGGRVSVYDNSLSSGECVECNPISRPRRARLEYQTRTFRGGESAGGGPNFGRRAHRPTDRRAYSGNPSDGLQQLMLNFCFRFSPPPHLALRPPPRACSTKVPYRPLSQLLTNLLCRHLHSPRTTTTAPTTRPTSPSPTSPSASTADRTEVFFFVRKGDPRTGLRSTASPTYRTREASDADRCIFCIRVPLPAVSLLASPPTRRMLLP